MGVQLSDVETLKHEDPDSKDDGIIFQPFSSTQSKENCCWKFVINCTHRLWQVHNGTDCRVMLLLVPLSATYEVANFNLSVKRASSYSDTLRAAGCTQRLTLSLVVLVVQYE
jgi:hypothetical protein